MKDIYTNFSELKKNRPRSYAINQNMKGSSILIFTPHGGGIEPGTTEICEWFNKNSFSYYSFTGRGKNCKDLHITSTRSDEPRLIKILSKHQSAVSFHGMKDYMRRKYDADVFLGGLDIKLVKTLQNKLNSAGFFVTTSIEHPTSSLAALNSNNVTNKCASGRGVQIELSERIRKTFFKNNYKFKKGRLVTTPRFEEFCCLIKVELQKVNVL